MALCEPSQKGLLADAPQRQSEMAGLPVRSHAPPLASSNWMGPSTRRGPLGRTVILTSFSDTEFSWKKNYVPEFISLVRRAKTK